MRLVTLLLSALLVTGAQAEEYDRNSWHSGWSDSDGDCQNLRHELLIKFSLSPVTYTREDNCYVDEGLWLGPYSGEFFSDSSELDVEHIVPLAWAHEHGGEGWTREQREAFAEDLENLWLVDLSLNRSKGSDGPDLWMPPYGPVKALYVQRFIAIVEKYELTASEVELRQYASIIENNQG